MEWQDMTMCRGRPLDPKAEKFLPKLCLLTKACHYNRRQFCVFTHEFGSCSEGPVCQGDTRTVSVPVPLDPMGITSQSIRGTSTGAVQTFITLILQGTEQASSMHLRSMGITGVPLPLLGSKTSEFQFHTGLFTLRMVTCERRALCKH